MARKTIIVGLNQTTWPRCRWPPSRRTSTGPGLGKPVLSALSQQRRRRRLRAGRADRGDGRDARPDDHRGQRARRRRSPAGAAATSACGGSCSRSAAVPVVVATCGVALLPRAWPSSPSTRARRQARRRRQRVHGLVHRRLRRCRPSGSRTSSPTGSAQPDAVLLAESPWYVSAGAIVALAFVFGGIRALRADRDLPRRHLVLRPVARRDDHAEHDPGRHRPGDGAGPGLRRAGWRATVASTCGIRPLLDAGPDDPAVRLPDPGARPVRSVPLHRHRGRHRLRRAGRHQAGRRRGQGRLARRPSRPAARPARRRGRRSPRCSCRWPRARSCSPPTRACSTCSSMAVIGGLVGAGALGYDVVLGLLPQRGVGQGRRRRASPSCCSA